jgi:hypothetical protein
VPIRIEFNEWKCKFCSMTYKLETMALACEQAHEVVFVPIYREDLQRLMQFILTKDERLITERLGQTLSKYSHGLKG